MFPPTGFTANTFGSATIWDGTTLVVADEATGFVVAYTFQGRFAVSHDILRPADSNDGNGFGRALAVGGDWMLVGTPDAPGVVPDGGAAYLFRRSGGQWSLREKLYPTDIPSGTGFGGWVGIRGNYGVVGTERGAAYVLELRPDGSFTQSLLDIDFDGGFNNTAVAISDNRIALGRWGRYVRIYARSNGTWIQEAEFESSALSGLALSDTHLVVSTFSGAEFYELQAGTWVLRSEIPYSDPSSFDFGYGVALSWPWAVVGAPEGAWVYEDVGSGWSHVGVLALDQRETFSFANPLSMNGSQVIFGWRRQNLVHMYDLALTFTGTEEVPRRPGLGSVYPNPLRSSGTLLLPGASFSQVRVVDLLGRSHGWASSSGNGSWRIDASSLAPGTYFAVPEGRGMERAIPFVRF